MADEIMSDLEEDTMMNEDSEGEIQEELAHNDAEEEEEEEEEIAQPHVAQDSYVCLTSTLASFKRTGGQPDIEDGIQVVDMESMLRRRVPEYDDQSIFADACSEGKKRRREFCGGTAPRIRIYGKSHNGGSVCVNVYGYYPVVRLLASCTPSELAVREITAMVEGVLEKSDKVRRPDGYRRVLSHRVVDGFSVYPYGSKSRFIEFKLASSEYVRRFGEYFLDNPEISVPNVGDVRFMPFSCHNLVEQFQADKKLAGFSWFKMRRYGETSSVDRSTCDIEVDVNVDDVIPYHEDSLAPLRMIVFDIECYRKKGLPKPENDAVIIIGCICVEYINGEISRSRKVVMQAKSGADIDPPDIVPSNGDMYLRFNDERAMMECFGVLVNTCFDPDFIAGHNMQNFDLPYVLRRAHILGSESAEFLGRGRGFKWTEPRENVQTRKNGTSRTSTTSETPGRIQLDTMLRIMALVPMRSYSLNYLSSVYLKDTKSDVPYQMIGPMWTQSDETRSRLARYCLKDTILTLGLIEFKDFCMVPSAVEMSRQTRVCANKLLRSGMQVKVFGVLYEIATNPKWDKEGTPAFFPYERPTVRGKDDKYDGAVVLEPSRGFYKNPTFCADYRSLYPTNIILLNIDWGTIVVHEKYGDLIHKTSPNGAKFVSPETRLGLLPQLEIMMMSSRDAAKAELKKHKPGTGLYNLYNSRQDQIKAIANSAYGILNASGGRLAREELALAVTSQGRVMINEAKRIAEAAPFNGRVIYGDTDSIMVQFPGVETIKEGFPKLVDLCKTVTDYFAPSVVLLQAEKGMHPMLMLGKKRYVYNLHIGPNAEPKLAFKGVELARRDNCGLVPEVMKAAFESLMTTGEPTGARKIISDALRELLGGRVDVNKLIITKAISREDYKNEPEHVAVAKRMSKRDKSYEVGTAERIPYIIVNRPGRTIADRAEDPLWAIMHGLTPDTDYYIHRQLAGPLSRALMFTMIGGEDKACMESLENAMRKAEISGNASLIEANKKNTTKFLEKLRKKTEDILFGSNALSVHPKKHQATSGAKGTIGAFFKKATSCAICRGATSGPGEDVCEACKTPKCSDCGTRDDMMIGDRICPSCVSNYFICQTCDRTVKKPECLSCKSGRCYRCGKAAVAKGMCASCAEQDEIRTKGKEAMSRASEIEDLDAQAMAAKAKCDKCRGYQSDDINCVARSCANLIKRATLAAEMAKRDLEKKKK